MKNETLNPIEENTAAIKKSNSLGWNFLKGISYGFGFFVGSAILVSILVYCLAFLKIDGNTFSGKVIQKVISTAQQAS